MRVNEADLERLGITREQWDGHHARINAEQPIEVRVVGGDKVLREALKAAGAEFSITHHTPESWDSWGRSCIVAANLGISPEQAAQFASEAGVPINDAGARH